MSAIFWIIVCSPLYFVFKPNPYWPLVASSKRAGLVLAASLGTGALIMVAALALGFVQPIGGGPAYTPPPPPATLIRPSPPHWTARQGPEYGYVETLTDEEIKSGKVLADTKYFRYLGLKNNLYSVSTQKGATTLTYACGNPCGMISITTKTPGNVTTNQVLFDGTRDIDLALTDAINGKMQVFQAEPKPPAEPAKAKTRAPARSRRAHHHSADH